MSQTSPSSPTPSPMRGSAAASTAASPADVLAEVLAEPLPAVIDLLDAEGVTVAFAPTNAAIEAFADQPRPPLTRKLSEHFVLAHVIAASSRRRRSSRPPR